MPTMEEYLKQPQKALARAMAARQSSRHPGPHDFADWAVLMAAHDDKHLDQLERALEGRA